MQVISGGSHTYFTSVASRRRGAVAQHETEIAVSIRLFQCEIGSHAPGEAGQHAVGPSLPDFSGRSRPHPTLRSPCSAGKFVPSQKPNLIEAHPQLGNRTRWGHKPHGCRVHRSNRARTRPGKLTGRDTTDSTPTPISFSNLHSNVIYVVGFFLP